jgi:hypothetical protein
MANAFMCSIEEKLVERNLMPSLYYRFVDDSITSQSNIASAEAFLSILNSLFHPFNSLWNWRPMVYYLPWAQP